MAIESAAEIGGQGMSGSTELVRQGHALVRVENDTQQMIATLKPRVVPTAIKKAIEELKAAPEFAAKTYYSIPFKEGGGSQRTINVEGVGHPGAMVMARNWGNLSLGCRIIDEDDENIYLEGVLMDYETNVREMRPFQVKKKAYRKAQAAEVVLSARELVMAVGSGTSKAIRNVILAYMPPAMKEQFFREAKLLAAQSLQGKGNLTLDQRLDMALAKFAQWGLTQSNIFAHLKVASKKEITEDHLGTLVGLFNALDSGETTKEDIITDATIVGGTSDADKVIAGAKKEEAKKAEKAAPEKKAAPAAKKEERPMPDALRDVTPAVDPESSAALFTDEGEPSSDESPYSAEFNAIEKQLTNLVNAGSFKEDIKSWGFDAANTARRKKLPPDEQTIIVDAMNKAYSAAKKKPVEG